MPSRLTQFQQKRERWRLATKLARPRTYKMQVIACLWLVRAMALLELWLSQCLPNEVEIGTLAQDPLAWVLQASSRSSSCPAASVNLLSRYWHDRPGAQRRLPVHPRIALCAQETPPPRDDGAPAGWRLSTRRPVHALPRGPGCLLVQAPAPRVRQLLRGRVRPLYQHRRPPQTRVHRPGQEESPFP